MTAEVEGGEAVVTDDELFGGCWFVSFLSLVGTAGCIHKATYWDEPSAAE